MRLTSCSRPFFSRCVALSFSDILRVAAALRARSAASVVLALPLVGRSRIWPTLDFTTKSWPRYLLMVFAFAGDSTMTSALPMMLSDFQGK